MDLLFVHDHLFQTGPDGEVYTVGSFPASVWERYLAHFDSVTVFARNGGMAATETHLARSNHASVRFVLIDDFHMMNRLLLGRGKVSSRLSSLMTRADAVVARLPSDLGLLAARLAAMMGIPLAVEAVGCAWDGYRHHGSIAARAYAPLAARRMRQAVGSASHVVYVTEHFLQKRYPAAGYQSNASNVQILRVNAADAVCRKNRIAAIRAGLPPRVGTVASLRVLSKGIQTAIAAIADLRKTGRDYQYHVLGAGDCQPWIDRATQAGVADLIHFDGARSSGDGVRDWLDGIDIHIQPSFQEGLPRATVEAMSRGCACLGSTAGGLPELLPVERLHRPGSTLELAALLDRFANDAHWIGEASKQDLATAERYMPAHLETRRQDFFAHFAQSIGAR